MTHAECEAARQVYGEARHRGEAPTLAGLVLTDPGDLKLCEGQYTGDMEYVHVERADGTKYALPLALLSAAE